MHQIILDKMSEFNCLPQDQLKLKVSHEKANNSELADHTPFLQWNSEYRI